MAIYLNKLLDATKIRRGTKVKVLYREREGLLNVTREKTATIIEVYRNHVLLDFGAYRECRRISDIVLGLGDTTW